MKQIFKGYEEEEREKEIKRREMVVQLQDEVNTHEAIDRMLSKRN